MEKPKHGFTENKDPRAAWEEWKGEFSFWSAAPIGRPSPAVWDLAREQEARNSFICCPIDGLAYWGFKSEEDRAEFMRKNDVAEITQGPRTILNGSYVRATVPFTMPCPAKESDNDS